MSLAMRSIPIRSDLANWPHSSQVMASDVYQPISAKAVEMLWRERNGYRDRPCPFCGRRGEGSLDKRGHCTNCGAPEGEEP